MKYTIEQIIEKCDFTLLNAFSTQDDIQQLCEEAKENNCASVCVNGCYVGYAKRELEGSKVKVCTVIGFPLGMMSTAAKVFEAEDAIKNGANEIDMVMNVGMLIGGQYDYVSQEIKEVIHLARKNNVIVKVIIEACYLNDDQKWKACEIIRDAGADYVKTSTGFGKGGATISDVALLKKCAGANIGVKAAGGIRSAEDASAMLEAGASRIGTSSISAIQKSYY